MKPLYDMKAWPPIAVYDLEANHWTEVGLCCHVDEFGNRVYFRTVKEYVDWLFTHFQGTYVWAHYGGHYDHRFILAECYSRGWEFSTANSGGSMVVISINNGEREIRFVDSYRLMPSSLQAIGKTVGLEKIELNPSLMHQTPFHEALEYCFRDCDIVVKGLQLMKRHLTAAGCDFAVTLASTAARRIRRDPGIDWSEFVYYNGKKWIPRDHIKRWDGPCYTAYFGGRTEMFMRGTFKGTFYLYDIVSSYPSSMREPLPLYFRGVIPPPRHLKNVKTFLRHCGITECTVYIPPGQVLGVLPVKDKTGRLIFPEGGPIHGRWTNIELLEALKQGVQIRHITCQWRFEARPYLRKFVDTFYGLRQRAKDENDEFGKYAYKILLNSSYGKKTETVDRKSFVSRGELDRVQRKIDENMSLYKPGTGAYERAAQKNRIEKSPTQGVYYAITQEVGPLRHTAVGAYITAYSRLKLFRMARKMIDRGATLYYCDTDSLIIDKPIPEEETGNKLGDWELQDVLSEVETLLPKVYRIVSAKTGKTHYKCKGCPICRKWEDEGVAAQRWEAFKHHRFTKRPEDAQLLGREGITGISTDIRDGTLMPRKTHTKCKTCRTRQEDGKMISTGRYRDGVCPSCNGSGMHLKPLARSLQSEDMKRVWNGETSSPICLGPMDVTRVEGQQCDSASI